MKQRQLHNRLVPEIGLGCMNLSHAYGEPPSEKDAIHLLHTAYDLGVRHFDTASLYGFGRNESLLAKAFAGRWNDIFLASKCGMTGVDGKRVIDGRPETLNATIDESLQRLQVEHIHLYYLHRWDKSVPIEESVGALSRMVEQGKIGAIGLSEVSANTLRKAHAVHPISAVQTEYSLWTRNPEIAVLNACKELDVSFVAFSPLARGFLAQGITSPDELVSGDIRLNMPRFQPDNFAVNVSRLTRIKALAEHHQCTTGQLALAWLLAQSDNIHLIPGTRSVKHLQENIAASEVELSADVVAELDELCRHEVWAGARYPANTQSEIDTEEFY